MKRKYPYLKDTQFLDLLYGQHNKTIYSKIIVLDWQEKEIEHIEGRTISGSISCNGDSTVRRTANLSIKIFNEDELYQNPESLFSINKKVYLEIGLRNNLLHLGEDYYPEYPIIWFPFGTYIIQSYSLSHDTSNGVTLNLSLGDKMCLLNGEAGGVIPASTNFESYDTLGPDGDLHSEYIRINQMIPEIVNHFGKEDLNNIIVNDIDDKIKQVLKWKGSNALYLWVNPSVPDDVFYTTIDLDPDKVEGLDAYSRWKITYNYDAGYTYVDFIYPGELAGNAGDTVCTILDKIKNTLGNYEYYYDVFGNFIFQEIKNYVNVSEWRTAWKNAKDEIKQNNYPEIYLPYAYNPRLNTAVYDFKNSDYVITYNNTPQFNMIKNDFVVWGKRKNTAGIELACRYHLAIDERPRLTEDLINSMDICFDTNVSDGIRRCFTVDKYKHEDGHVSPYPDVATLKEVLPQGIVGKYYLVSQDEEGHSGNFIYSWVTDVSNYNNLLNNYLTSADDATGVNLSEDDIKNEVTPTADYIKMPLATYYAAGQFIIPGPDENGNQQTDWRNILYFSGVYASAQGLDSGYYWAELCNEWPKIYDIEHNKWDQEALDFPASLDWWLDLIDNDSLLTKFSVNNIGRRSYSTVVSECNCVFEPDIPDVIMVDIGNTEEVIDSRSGMTIQQFKELGLVPTQVSQSVYDALMAGGTFNSCYQYVRQLLTDYTNYNESISLTCLPLYHLEPNTRISINDPEAGIYGDYIINTINFSLDHGSTMSISAKKCVEKI